MPPAVLLISDSRSRAACVPLPAAQLLFDNQSYRTASPDQGCSSSGLRSEALKAVEPEETDVVAGPTVHRKVGHDLADDAAELVAMTGARGGDGDLR